MLDKLRGKLRLTASEVFSLAAPVVMLVDTRIHPGLWEKVGPDWPITRQDFCDRENARKKKKG